MLDASLSRKSLKLVKVERSQGSLESGAQPSALVADASELEAGCDMVEPLCGQSITNQVLTPEPKPAGWVPLLSKPPPQPSPPCSPDLVPTSKMVFQQGTVPWLNFYTPIFLCNDP